MLTYTFSTKAEVGGIDENISPEKGTSNLGWELASIC